MSSKPMNSINCGASIQDSTTVTSSIQREESHRSQSFENHDSPSPSESGSEDGEAQDSFDVEGMRMPRVTSSTIPIVLQVAPRSGSFQSHDPLFQGVCLYSGQMTAAQRDRIEKEKDPQTQTTPVGSPRTSWSLSSVFSGLY